MKNFVFGTLLAIATATGAMAADLGAPAPVPVAPAPVGPWDFAIGAGVTSNYLFRGISQSNNAPSVNASAELRYNFNSTWQAYVGAAGASIKLTNVDASPSLELDVFGGVRASLGNFSADVGAIAYTYHGLGLRPIGPILVFPTNPTFFEGYMKLGYKVTDWLNLGANAFYSPNFLDTGSHGTYISGTAKVTLPHDFAISGEIGRQYFGRTDLLHGFVKLPSYNYWNAGLAYTFKFATLDLRYHGTSLSKFSCAVITGPTNFVTPSSKYCGSTFVATLSFALEGKDLK